MQPGDWQCAKPDCRARPGGDRRHRRQRARGLGGRRDPARQRRARPSHSLRRVAQRHSGLRRRPRDRLLFGGAGVRHVVGRPVSLGCGCRRRVLALPQRDDGGLGHGHISRGPRLRRGRRVRLPQQHGGHAQASVCVAEGQPGPGVLGVAELGDGAAVPCGKEMTLAAGDPRGVPPTAAVRRCIGEMSREERSRRGFADLSARCTHEPHPAAHLDAHQSPIYRRNAARAAVPVLIRRYLGA